MLNKTLLAVAVAATLLPGVGAAADSPHTLTGNVGLYSQYIFRGNTQTNKDPALQGGFDYSHASGLYAGTWASNISWLTDSPAATGYSRSSLEMDFYGGFRGSFGKSDFGYDVGVLYYYYPGTSGTAAVPFPAGIGKANSTELYGALSWKWLSVKYSHSIDNKTFGVTDSSGTYYLDITATVPVNDKLNLIGHYGMQEFKGTGGACGVGVSNDTCASFEDWKVGATYALPRNFTIGGYFTGTDMSAAQKAFYTNGSDARWIGKDTFTVFISKTF